MKRFKLWNALLGWGVFAVAAVTYLLTIEPTASFWDCGEFISSAWKLDVGHPPGAPFFMLMGHFAALFASEPSQVAACVNALSALASAFTILFLFWTITALAKKLLGVAQTGKLMPASLTEMTMAQGIGILGAGVVGALAYTFSDTFWFSAVEGEVYASSSLFTAVVFWAILKWDEVADEEGSDRWLILIAYLMGLSIGVHLLNLLTIPAIVLVYYFRRHEFSWMGVFTAMVASVVILALILYGMIPGIPTLAGWFELLFVNVLGFSYNTGLYVYLILLMISLVWAISETYMEKSKLRMAISFVLAFIFSGAAFLKESWGIALLLVAAMSALFAYKKEWINGRLLNTAVVMITVIVVGYSSYAALVIRSSANTPMDQNSPDNVFSLKMYLNREQYGDTPLLYGQYYNAPVELQIKGNMCIPVQSKGEAQYAPKPKASEDEKDEYVVTGHKTKYKYMNQFMTFFPRMHSSSPNHIAQYKQWAGIDDRHHNVRYDYCGQRKSDYCPTFTENMRFFFSYQVHYMYWRYFMWNFAGRQNDIQGSGESYKGNWISGISFLDDARLGDQSKLPTELKENKGHNVYYMLPLLLGILGIVYQLGKSKRGAENFILTFLLFFLTGLAIVVYLNQTPLQPRERDYAYAGSFYAFCIWIGLGAMALAEWAGKAMKSEKVQAAIALVVVAAATLVPVQMASQNWDDHDRSNRYSCRDFGANYLRSCEQNGIIFCNGDNDTFPLWYNQEVEGEGTDKHACNLSYLQTDWYIDQQRRPYYDAEGAPITWDKKDYITGTNDIVRADTRHGYSALDVRDAFKFVRSDDKRTKNSEGENFFPTNKLYIPVEEEIALGEKSIFNLEKDPTHEGLPLAEALYTKQFNYLTKSEMMVLEMLRESEWKRPIYFAVTVGEDSHLGLTPYMELTGLAYQVTPFASPNGQPRVNTEKMYDNMMNKFAYGNMNMPGIYIDENLMRMCRTHRMMFTQLADALYREGKKDSVVKVLDYAEEMLPEYNIPCDYSTLSMASLYAYCGENDKAKAMFEKLAVNSAEYIDWCSSMSRAELNANDRIYRQHLTILKYVVDDCRRFGYKEIADAYDYVYGYFN